MGKPCKKPSENPAVKVASGIGKKYLSPGKPSSARRALQAIRLKYFQISSILETEMFFDTDISISNFVSNLLIHLFAYHI